MRRTPRRTTAVLASALLTFALAACGGDDGPTGPEEVSINGRWSGSTGEISLTLTLNESNGNVTGSGNISGPGGSAALTASGSRAGTSLSLTLTSAGFTDLNFTGSIQSATTITGTLNGSGFNNISITLTKQ